jgi:hypothetical protein
MKAARKIISRGAAKLFLCLFCIVETLCLSLLAQQQPKSGLNRLKAYPKFNFMSLKSHASLLARARDKHCESSHASWRFALGQTLPEFWCMHGHLYRPAIAFSKNELATPKRAVNYNPAGSGADVRKAPKTCFRFGYINKNSFIPPWNLTPCTCLPLLALARMQTKLLF